MIPLINNLVIRYLSFHSLQNKYKVYYNNCQERYYNYSKIFKTKKIDLTIYLDKLARQVV